MINSSTFLYNYIYTYIIIHYTELYLPIKHVYKTQQMSPETAAMLLFPPCSAVCGFLKELYSLEKKQIHFFQTKHFIQLGGINGRYIVAGMCAFLLVLGVLKFIGFTCLL